jgi:hypothetical protein
MRIAAALMETMLQVSGDDQFSGTYTVTIRLSRRARLLAWRLDLRGR